MKYIYSFVLFFLFITPLVVGQGTVMTFAQAQENGISIDEIDARYIDALHSTPELGLFNENPQPFIQQFREFYTELTKFLNTNGFYWQEPTRIFSRIYFSAEGQVEYFFLNESQAKLSSEKMEQFTNLTETFISNNTLGISGDKPFAQCSPVVYTNMEKPEN
ncbi:MAG: hypothetical protein JJU37_13220 [Balneolaceae bacterium]|nr:hypothetical protein [Balneolaceae bacterium]